MLFPMAKLFERCVEAALRHEPMEIFGDEKRLNALRAGAPLFGGRMLLATIWVFHVPSPLP